MKLLIFILMLIALGFAMSMVTGCALRTCSPGEPSSVGCHQPW